MQGALPSKKLFLICVAILCLSFAMMQLYLSSHIMFTPDELWVAHSVYSKYRLYLPYRDFAPYKTVLGYYLFLIPLTFTKNPVAGLIYLKYFLTLINTTFLFLCSLWFTRFFSYKVILVSLTLLISTQFFTNFSADIRVDLLAYWCCLVSVLLLLEKRFVYAGLALALAFCVSQKAIWYGLASNFALIMVWIIFQRQRKNLIPIILFNFSFIAVVALYLIAWMYVSDINSVIDSVFYQAAIVYQINLYQNGNNYLLHTIIKQNLLYLTFWLLSILSLLTHKNSIDLPRRVFIVTFSWTTMFFLIIYKQPFLYYTVAVIPPLFLLYADFISWLNSLLTEKVSTRINGRYLIYVFVVSMIMLAFVKIDLLILPPTLTWLSMNLILCVPILIYLCLKNNITYHKNTGSRNQKVYPRMFLAGAGRRLIGQLSLASIYLIIFTCGVIIPQIDNAALFVKTGYQYQQLAMHTLSNLLKDDTTYVAGVDLLYNKNQAVSGNFYLEQNLLFLDEPNTELEKMMLPALDLDPANSIDKMITTINKNPVKVFIHCPFMVRLPRLMNYINTQYAYLWGNIYIYGPQIPKGGHQLNLKFSGLYTLESEQPVYLDGKKIMPHTQLALQANKNYQSIANHSYRFILLANDIGPLPKKYQAEVPERLFQECTELYINHHRRCVYFQVLPIEKNKKKI